MKHNNPDDTVKVKDIPPRSGVKTGKPVKIATTALRMGKTAFSSTGGTTQGSGGNFYSPELSTDFLELPQSLDERRNFYRFFYDNHPLVGQAIDLHVDLPMSRIRLGMPEAKNRELAEKSMRFCERWVNSVHLLQRLMEISHDYHLLGEAVVFCEDTSPDMPRDVREQMIREITPEGEATTKWEPYPDADKREVDWLKKNYFGWTSVSTLPPEQIHIEAFPFTQEKLIELIPDSKTKAIVQKADQGDLQAIRIANSMPQEIVQAVKEGQNIPLNTDPDAGSFVYVMARKRSSYEPRGQSILQRCLRPLIWQDKIRQSLTSISSRHMTPYRLVYAENMDAEQTEMLREQVDLALQDPDYSVITNFEVHWEEMGAEQRLPDWSWVWENTDKHLYAGLGVTEALLSGESSYSGDKIHLEVINIRYLLLRELFQQLVEGYFFKPMCRRMGFVEEDEDGVLKVIVPKLTFTRLALRDNQETFDALFNLYQKGSLDIDVILDLLNIDPITTFAKLKRDIMTPNDALYNEFLRAAYSTAGNALADQSDIIKHMVEGMGLNFKAKEEGGSRF